MRCPVCEMPCSNKECQCTLACRRWDTIRPKVEAVVSEFVCDVDDAAEMMVALSKVVVR